MPSLKDRNQQIPNGLRFRITQTGWDSRSVLGSHPSFDALVGAVIDHRRANHWLASTHHWPMDRDSVAVEVDAYNAKICADNGWSKYILSGQPEKPAQKKTTLEKLRAVAAGGSNLVEWIRSGAEAVPPEQAERRASVCASCPNNDTGDFTAFFTRPVSEAILLEVSKRKSWSLKTSHDDKLGVCSVCLCPLKLVMHVPLETKMKRMDAKTRNALPSHCWINLEVSGSVPGSGGDAPANRSRL